MTEPKFCNKSVCITAAARAPGAAIARRFASAGSHVHIADVLDEKTLDLGGSLADDGFAAATHHLDVTDEGDWQTPVAAIGAAGTGLDVLVNSAGIIIRKSLSETSKAEWTRRAVGLLDFEMSTNKE